jgi:hypothetical protein
MLPVQALCHPPLTSAYRGAHGIWVRALAEVPGGTPTRRDRRRCRGGGVWRRGRTTSMVEQACLEGGVLEHGEAGEPWSGACCAATTPRGRLQRQMSRAAACVCATSHSQPCLPGSVVPTRQAVLAGGRRALSPITEHQKVETRTWWIVREPMVGFCFLEPTVRQCPHRSSTRAVCYTPEPPDGEPILPRVTCICGAPCVSLAGPGKRRHAPGVCGRYSQPRACGRLHSNGAPEGQTQGEGHPWWPAARAPDAPLRLVRPPRVWRRRHGNLPGQGAGHLPCRVSRPVSRGHVAVGGAVSPRRCRPAPRPGFSPAQAAEPGTRCGRVHTHDPTIWSSHGARRAREAHRPVIARCALSRVVDTTRP